MKKSRKKYKLVMSAPFTKTKLSLSYSYTFTETSVSMIALLKLYFELHEQGLKQRSLNQNDDQRAKVSCSQVLYGQTCSFCPCFCLDTGIQTGFFSYPKQFYLFIGLP